MRELTCLTPNGNWGSEGEAADELDVSRLGDGPVPGAELGAGGRVVIERDTVAERLAIAREVMVVEDVERLGADFEIDFFLDGEFSLDRNVGIAIGCAAHAAHPRTGAEIIAVRE